MRLEPVEGALRSPHRIAKSEIEKVAIELLERQGCQYIYAPSIAPGVVNCRGFLGSSNWRKREVTRSVTCYASEAITVAGYRVNSEHGTTESTIENLPSNSLKSRAANTSTPLP